MGGRRTLENVTKCIPMESAPIPATHAGYGTGRLAGFKVVPMIRRPHAHELLVRMSVDATLGPLIMFGAGGTSVEFVANTVWRCRRWTSSSRKSR